jgi:hypothetical protein
MGATLKRRDGSGRVGCGFKPDFAVISFNVFCTNFRGFGAFVPSAWYNVPISDGNDQNA